MTTVRRNRQLTSLRALMEAGKRALPCIGLLLILGLPGPALAAPATAEGWYQQADAQYQEGNVDEAIKSLEEALKAAIWTWRLTPIFDITAASWLRTVVFAIASSSAISAGLEPDAILTATSASAFVRR